MTAAALEGCDPLPDTVLILVRHGATLANMVRPYVLQGLRPDSELTEEGVVQTKAAGLTLQSYAIAKVYCSPLKRAYSTACLIADFLEVPADVDKSLVEADIGQWTGLTWEEIEQRWPDEYCAFHDDPERHGYLGGENLAQVCDRILPAMEGLVARHVGETILVVGHGVANRVLLAHWLGLPLRYARRLPQDNGAYSIVDFQKTQAKVRTLNMASPAPASRRPGAGGVCASHGGWQSHTAGTRPAVR
jgi:broad specificity phosphatase PhoE